MASWLAGWAVLALVGWLACWFVGWDHLQAWLASWLAGWAVLALVGWLAYWFVGWDHLLASKLKETQEIRQVCKKKRKTATQDYSLQNAASMGDAVKMF